ANLAKAWIDQLGDRCGVHVDEAERVLLDDLADAVRAADAVRREAGDAEPGRLAQAPFDQRRDEHHGAELAKTPRSQYNGGGREPELERGNAVAAGAKAPQLIADPSSYCIRHGECFHLPELPRPSLPHFYRRIINTTLTKYLPLKSIYHDFVHTLF